MNIGKKLLIQAKRLIYMMNWQTLAFAITAGKNCKLLLWQGQVSLTYWKVCTSKQEGFMILYLELKNTLRV